MRDSMGGAHLELGQQSGFDFLDSQIEFFKFFVNALLHCFKRCYQIFSRYRLVAHTVILF